MDHFIRVAEALTPSFKMLVPVLLKPTFNYVTLLNFAAWAFLLDWLFFALLALFRLWRRLDCFNFILCNYLNFNSIFQSFLIFIEHLQGGRRLLESGSLWFEFVTMRAQRYHIYIRVNLNLLLFFILLFLKRQTHTAHTAFTFFVWDSYFFKLLKLAIIQLDSLHVVQIGLRARLDT